MMSHQLSMSAWVIVLALISGIVAHPSLAAEGGQVTMRSAERADGGRLLIEWSDPIRVLQKKQGDRLTLRFSRPLSVDIGPALDRLASYLDADRTEVGGTDLTLILKPGVATKLEVKKRKVVIIDLMPRKVDETDIKVTASALQNGMRLAIQWPQPVGFKTRDEDGRLMVNFSSNGRIQPSDLGYLNETFQPWFSRVQQLPNPAATTLEFHLKPMIVSSVRQAGDRLVEIDFIRDASSATKTDKTDKRTETEPEPPEQAKQLSSSGWPPKPEKRPAAAGEAAGLGERDQAEAETLDTSAVEADELVFDWEDGVGAAIFKRAGYLWVVFDAPKDFSRSLLPPPPPASLLAGEVMQADDATIIRFRMTTDADFSVRRDENGRWLIEPDDDPKLPASISVLRTEAPGMLRAAAASNGRIVHVTDPLVGDQLGIWPVQQTGLGHPTRRRFVDLEIKESIQGLVWRPLSDDLNALADFDGIELRSGLGLTISDYSNPASTGDAGSDVTAGPETDHQRDPDDRLITGSVWFSEKGVAELDPAPDGTPVSRSEPAVIEPPSDEAEPSSYLNLAGSGVDRNLVVETRRVLRQAIRKSAPEKRDQARLDLARVLVAEGLASEAEIILDTTSEQLEGPLALSRKALRGASAFLARDLNQASTLLYAAEFDDDVEIGLWRSALSSLDQDWQAAVQGWKQSSNSLDIYPTKMRLELGLLALETAIETNDDNQIRKGFRRLKKLELEPYEAARIDRMHALKAVRDGDVKRAEEILQGIADGRYPIISAMADFELASLHQDKEPNDANSLAALHDRLPLWRGLPQEIMMIDRLASRYRNADEPRPALHLWERLSTLYPETEDDTAIRSERRATYVDALINLAGERISLFDAYSIYLDFINLMPGEPDDRPVHRNLARHLAGLDLLDEAVSVLQPMIESSVDQVEAAKIGAKVAELLLLQDRLDEALVTLDRTETRGAANLDELTSERKVLRARTLARLGRNEEALEQIRDLQTRPARHARADIFWQQRNWNRLANVVETILDDPNLAVPLSYNDQKAVLWLALARGRLGQAKELSELRRRYMAEMASGPWNEAFAVGTQTDDQIKDIDSLLRQTEGQLTELRRFRDDANADR